MLFDTDLNKLLLVTATTTTTKTVDYFKFQIWLATRQQYAYSTALAA